MQTDCRTTAMFVALAIGGAAVARAQNAIEQLQPLVEISARRLLVAKQVALAKWDSGFAVEDAPVRKGSSWMR
jgi:chorismate mutase